MAPIEKARSASVSINTLDRAEQKKIAEAADKLGDRDGRVSLKEVDAFVLQQATSLPTLVGAIAAPFNAFGAFRDTLGLVETIESAQEKDLSSIKDEKQKHVAEAADQAGNKNGKVSLSELRDYVTPSLIGHGLDRLKDAAPLFKELQAGTPEPEAAPEPEPEAETPELAEA